MSEAIKDGGPAFPCGGVVTDDGILYEGMTLRDYFAAKAMQEILKDSLIDAREIDKGTSVYSKIRNHLDDAEFSYEMADAMLKAREAK